MMMRVLCFIAAGLGFTSCLSSEGNKCSATLVEPTLTATGPKTVAVNQTATYTLSYAPQSTCGTFENFLEQAGTTTNSLIVGVRVRYDRCDCPAVTAALQTTYSIKPTQAGTYYINFVSNNTAGFITDTLVVQ